MTKRYDPFATSATLDTSLGSTRYCRIAALEEAGLTEINRLPFSIRVLLEAAVRTADGETITEDDIRHIAAWGPETAGLIEIPFRPARVVLQDFTGVPAVVDLAAMRSAMKRLGGDPKKINPLCPVDLVIDHSVQVDHFGTSDALEKNVGIEFHRNRERYEFLRWGQKAFDNFRVVPPSVGIIHQVNLEYLAQCVFRMKEGDGWIAVPDSLIGTDSHTTQINGLGVVGWGVGGIEAEAVMLGQPMSMLLPEVVGVELSGRLPTGTTATDLVLTLTQMLRKEGVVGKFVEYFGEGVAHMSVPDRATLSNMAPEYGATMGFFPMDERTLEFLRLTGRDAKQIAFVEEYAKAQKFFRGPDAPVPEYSRVLKLDLGTVVPSLAGPKRPHDRVSLTDIRDSFVAALTTPTAERGFGLESQELVRSARCELDSGVSVQLGHGMVAIAAITSCTNTSNPGVMLAAGLLAKKAVDRGMRVPGFVKTSLSPGSRVVSDYLDRAGLTEPLAKLGFTNTGYGCMTCIGNSGPLPEPVAVAIQEGNLVAASVLSGYRNFEGRVHPLVKANYLASPPLVVAFALAGTVLVDFGADPVGTDVTGRPVYLDELWPTPSELEAAMRDAVRSEMYRERYTDVFMANPKWTELAIRGEESDLYDWDRTSTYVQEPPFLVSVQPEPQPVRPVIGARCLIALGDSVTTDHISPAGAIPTHGPAGTYLQEHGVAPEDFNSFGSRRGNDRVMARGTFANIRIRNQLAPGTEGGYTRYFPEDQLMSIYDASVRYRRDGVPLIVLAGREYGSGSSRDWAAKGPWLLGVRVVLAQSFERIHRSNLVGMGILPLELPTGRNWQSLGISGSETFDFPGLNETLVPGGELEVVVNHPRGFSSRFTAKVRIDTPMELEYYRHGGILQTVLRRLRAESPEAGSQD
ncbi:MAG: aconitate hydratase AcnA [Planctomycetia bacterium]|nr:aconitate hydratase AcnA [Planctomycetia bacterium]